MSRDLMHSDEIREVVRHAYRGVDRSTEAVARKLYSSEELAELPRSAMERSLGVANHLRFADVEAGETILDIGCGGGIDSLLVASRSGPEGDFVLKLEKAGFDDVEVVHREPLSVDDCALYPLFTEEVIRLMRELLADDKQDQVAIAVVVRASSP